MNRIRKLFHQLDLKFHYNKLKHILHKKWQKIRCRLGYHRWHYFTENKMTLEGIISIKYRDCFNWPCKSMQKWYHSEKNQDHGIWKNHKWQQDHSWADIKALNAAKGLPTFQQHEQACINRLKEEL